MDCCAPTNRGETTETNCPKCGQNGRRVPLITLKSLLKPAALATLVPDRDYVFCPNPFCETVYFALDGSLAFFVGDLKVPVFQKDSGLDVPVCYCFDWTRERIVQALRQGKDSLQEIKTHVQAGRCGCEVNNPQGACCMGNVAEFIRQVNGN
ncbi:putative iron-sulfur cluster-binding metallochaperone [Geobacillus thermoleovorans]|uniref:putative iron-sulfur cluster-binding metallochaperone n=1 Tax=Geobacillus thermoleovorans TaxID=33941 RepID=UPI003D24E474